MLIFLDPDNYTIFYFSVFLLVTVQSVLGWMLSSMNMVCGSYQFNVPRLKSTAKNLQSHSSIAGQCMNLIDHNMLTQNLLIHLVVYACRQNKLKSPHYETVWEVEEMTFMYLQSLVALFGTLTCFQFIVASLKPGSLKVSKAYR